MALNGRDLHHGSDRECGAADQFVAPGAPPALLLHGLDDTTVKLFNTRDLTAALTTAGVGVRTLELPGIGHVGLIAAMARPLRWRAPVLDEIVAFVAAIDRAK